MMRKTIFTLTVLMLLVCFLIEPAYSEAKNKSQKKATKLTKVTENPFDSASKLFSTRNSNNEVNIYNALVNMANKFTKSEYESSDVFKSRVDRICEATLIGNIKFCDTLGFLSRNGIKYEYDADAQKMTVSVPVTREAIETSYTIVGKKKYTATNAYGAKARVTTTEYSTFAVSMRRDETIATKIHESSKAKFKKAAGPYRRNMVLYVSMNPEEARSLKTSGGILITGKLNKPYIDNYTNHEEPTITEPTETINKLHYVIIDPSEIWVVDTKNGKIWCKEKFVTSEDFFTTVRLDSPDSL